jgi:hypothetical protein
MEKTTRQIKQISIQQQEMCNKQHVFTQFWHRNVRYLSMKCALHWKKLTLKVKMVLERNCLSCFMYEVWMFLLLFTVYKALRLHIFMIILVVWNVRYILAKFKMLTHSADSYMLSNYFFVHACYLGYN